MFPNVFQVTALAVEYNKENLVEAMRRGKEIHDYQLSPGWYVQFSEGDEPLGPFATKGEANDAADEMLVDLG